VLGLKPAPEFEGWLQKMTIFRETEQVELTDGLPPSFASALLRLA
jgi:ethanolamine ammonia-lyase large subunit